MMPTPDDFLATVEAFIVTHDLTPTRFGKEAVRDPNFVHDLRRGRSPSLAVASSVDEWMRAYAKAHPRRRLAKGDA